MPFMTLRRLKSPLTARGGGLENNSYIRIAHLNSDLADVIVIKSFFLLRK